MTLLAGRVGLSYDLAYLDRANKLYISLYFTINRIGIVWYTRMPYNPGRDLL